MPFTRAAALVKATVTQTELVNAKLRLFKSGFVPSVNSVLADFTAQEADFDGYTAGGNTIAAFLDPSNNPAGGATTISPISNFVWAHVAADVGNMIGGWWLMTAGGDVWCYDQYPQPIAMAAPGDAIPQIVQLTEGRNAV